MLGFLLLVLSVVGSIWIFCFFISRCEFLVHKSRMRRLERLDRSNQSLPIIYKAKAQAPLPPIASFSRLNSNGLIKVPHTTVIVENRNGNNRPYPPIMPKPTKQSGYDDVVAALKSQPMGSSTPRRQPQKYEIPSPGQNFGQNSWTGEYAYHGRGISTDIN